MGRPRVLADAVCRECGKLFHPPSRLATSFCSRDCYDRWRTGRLRGPYKPTEVRACEHCGNEFEVGSSVRRSKSLRFCSRVCFAASRHLCSRVVVGRYARVGVAPDDPMFAMADKRKRVAEHRLVVARALGRPLNRRETVHHINGDPLDNRLSNLQLRTGNHGHGVVHRCRSCGSHDIEAVKLSVAEQFT